MILDVLENLKKYENIHYGIKKCIDFMKENNIEELKKGRYEIDGKNIYLNIDEYTTKEKTESFPEAHRFYADIQTVIEGEEFIGYCDKKSCQTKIEYDNEKDIEFLSGECEYLDAKKGNFFLFLPDEVHHPCIINKERNFVRKAVFKIRIN